MNNNRRTERVLHWSTAAWAVGTAALIAALPWAASGRLPDRLATHWSTGSSTPDGSMPLWAVSVLPALIWAVLAAGVILPLWRGGGVSRTAVRPWMAAILLPMGVLLVGVQATIVRANLDRADWRQAQEPTLWVITAFVAAAVAGAVGWLIAARGRSTTVPAAQEHREGPILQIPEGQQMVWFSRVVNPWLHALAVPMGLVAVAAVIGLVSGLADPAPMWMLLATFALTSLALAGCATARVRVSEKGLEVAFGPFGWPARRWTVADIEHARTENRTPVEVGGWGYRLGDLGTTVMLRSGECLVIREQGKEKEFAVSVDDAERGAALLNALRASQAA